MFNVIMPRIFAQGNQSTPFSWQINDFICWIWIQWEDENNLWFKCISKSDFPYLHWHHFIWDKLCPNSIKCNISMFQVIYPNIGGVCFSFFFLYWKLCQCVCHKNFKSFLKSQFFRSFILMHFQRLLLNNHLLTKVQLITNTHITCPLSLGNNH